MIYTVLLNPAIDHIVNVDGFEAGQTVKAKYSLQLPAGKAMNVAVAVASLKEKVKVIGIMGSRDKLFFDEFATKHNVDTEWVVVDGSVRRNTTISDIGNKKVSHIREPGFRIAKKSADAVKKILLDSIKPSDWIVFSGSLPLGLKNETYKNIISACRKKTRNIILDASGMALLEGIRGKPFAITPNEFEFEEIFDEKINGIQYMILKAKSLIDRGIEKIFISLGRDGLLAVDSSSVIRIRTHIRNTTNTVGCGDAMLAGLLIGFKRKLTFSKICELGVACGTANTYTVNPGLINQENVDKCLSRIKKVTI